MAEDRTNMVSLLDIGSLMGGKTPKIAEIGDGFSELNEDWSPKTQTTQYINMRTESNTVNGYNFSTTLDREFISDEMQETINTLLKKFPTGEKCNTYYYRYYKTDFTGTSGSCIRVPVTVCPASTGGGGGDVLKSSIQLNGRGDAEEGIMTIAEDGSFSWEKN